MTKKQRRQFSEKFKQDVVNQLNEGVPIKELSKKYNIHHPAIYRWRKELANLASNKKEKPCEIPTISAETLIDSSKWENTQATIIAIDEGMYHFTTSLSNEIKATLEASSNPSLTYDELMLEIISKRISYKHGV